MVETAREQEAEATGAAAEEEVDVDGSAKMEAAAVVDGLGV